MAAAKQGVEAADRSRRRLTQADVARHAGVSPAIVSAVLNGRQYGNIRISDRTRGRVLEAVRELGYSPNIAARNLAGGANKLVGVFTFQRLFPLVKEDFYYEFLVGVEEEAEAAGYNLLMLTAAKDQRGERSLFPDGANGLQLADGGILVGWGERQDEIRRLAGENYPFVFIGERHIEGVDVHYVAADYLSATAEIVDRVARLGHERVGMVLDANSNETIPGRRAGYRAGIGRNPGLDGDHLVALGGAAEGAELAIDVEAVLDWARATRLTALVVESTTTAAAIRDVSAARGLAVPGDLSLVGLSGTPELAPARSITELSIPRREMGREAMRLLVALLADPVAAPASTTLSCSLRDAGSLAAPSSPIE
ncbi:LacI family DNA-binding transcriptional regulator [Gryllotalpicola kribbensis]|uniref:LacI family DNA-binding transcriptional regulator n=1 Tax=Gryllotalpicola kribbensis TaxID=993084 RepID=A0ABP8ATA8_9MICO